MKERITRIKCDGCENVAEQEIDFSNAIGGAGKELFISCIDCLDLIESEDDNQLAEEENHERNDN